MQRLVVFLCVVALVFAGMDPPSSNGYVYVFSILLALMIHEAIQNMTKTLTMTTN